MQDKFSIYPSVPRRPANEIAEERREQIAQERAAVEAEKNHRLLEQRSMDSPPDRRIALWERRHGLPLPRAANHPLMQFIADSTDLALEQVHAEQRRRADLRPDSYGTRPLDR